jgi:hypothetical protein
VDADHEACARDAAAFNPVLLAALAAVRRKEARSA